MFIVFSSNALGDVTDNPYLLRLGLALDRTRNFPDTTGRQASLAFPLPTSRNPAADDWLQFGELTVFGSLLNVEAFSESGTLISATAGTANISVPDLGALSITVARTDTLSKETRHDLKNNLESNELFLGYSRRIFDRIALGGEIRLVDAKVREEFFTTEVRDVAIRSNTDIFTRELNLGLLAQINEEWYTAFTSSISFTTSDTELRGTAPLGSFDDESWLYSIRSGLGYMPSKSLSFFLDGNYLKIDSDLGGIAEIARFAFGSELWVAKTSVLRVGVGIDTDNETTLSIGYGYFGIKSVMINFAYQYNAAPEIRAEFGRFHLLSASLIVPF